MIVGMTNVKDLFRFRKPQLKEGELALVDRARAARERIDACRTRFESIEMLFTTSSDDALILCRHLYRDILDAFSELYSINDRGGSVGSKSRLDAVPEGGTRALLAEMEQWLGEGSEERPSPDDIRKIVMGLGRAVSDLGSIYREQRKTVLRTPLDSHRRRLLLHGAIFGGVVIVLSVSTMYFVETRASARAARFDGYFSKGMERSRSGDYVSAAENYRKAVELLPQGPRAADAYNNLGWALTKREQYEEAITAYNAALRLQPDHLKARNNLRVTKRWLQSQRRE